MGYITILESTGKAVLAKKITVNGIEPYSDAAYFTPTVVEIDSFDTLYSTIAEVATHQNRCVIRGYPKPPEVVREITFDDDKPSMKGNLYRRKRSLFDDRPSDVIVIDVDGGEAASDDPVEALQLWVVDNLPSAFHDISFVYQWSSSFGIKPGLRAHLWFLLETPATCATLKSWAVAWNASRGENVLDMAIYNPVQVVYTANPIIEDEFGLFGDLPAERVGCVEALLGDRVALDLDVEVVRGDDADWAALEGSARVEGLTLEDAALYLSKISNDANTHYDTWLNLGMALHHQFGDEGLPLWLQWSAQSVKYDARDTTRRYKSFSQMTGGKPYTFASVIKLAGGRIATTAAALADSEDVYKALVQQVDGCNTYAELTGRVIESVALARLNEAMRSSLLARVRVRAKDGFGEVVSVSQLAKQVKAAQRANQDEIDELATNLENVLSEQVLREHFAHGVHLAQVNGIVIEYIDGVWRRLPNTATIAKRVLVTIKNILGGDTTLTEAIKQLIKEGDRTERLGALVESITRLITMEVTRQGDDPMGMTKIHSRSVMNVQNGELWFDFKTASVALLPHDPDSNLWHQMSTAYDPAATCPRFEAMLRRTFSHAADAEDQMRHFLELVGWMAQESRAHADAWVLWKSPGGTGKTTTMSCIEAVLGPSAVRHLSFASVDKRGMDSHFEDGMAGVLMVLDDDFKARATLPDDILKTFTGAKMATANPKHAARYSYIRRAVPFILTNNWPGTRDISEGMRRRANVFDGGSPVGEDDRDPALLYHIIENELPGVLNLLIDGWLRVLKRGKFKMPVGCQRALESWLMSGSPVMRFIREAMEVTGDDADFVSGQDAFELYHDFCRHYEGIEHMLSRQKFFEALTDSGIAMDTGKSQERWLRRCRVKASFRLILTASEFG